MIGRPVLRGLAALLCLAPMPAVARTAWPHGARAAVALTYDDALRSQLDIALPALDAAGLRGTFFLSGVRVEDIARWRAVARRGHELANHTIFHYCLARTFPADPRYTLEAYSPRGLLAEIAQQNVLLAALDGRSRHGFATPCGQTTAGGVDYLEPLRRAGLVTYARGVAQSAEELAADPATLDPMHIPARGFAEGTTAEQMIAHVEAAQAGGGMAVFLFHGIGGDQLQVSADAHRALLRWLRKHRRDVWVAPLQEVLDWAGTHRTDGAGRPWAVRGDRRAAAGRGTDHGPGPCPVSGLPGSDWRPTAAPCRGTAGSPLRSRAHPAP